MLIGSQTFNSTTWTSLWILNELLIMLILMRMIIVSLVI